MDYSNSNITLSDSLSGYITANEDECDNSRYLSILSQDITLQEMNVTISDEQIVENDQTELMSTEGTNEPFIFTVDGTNEIYGVQVAQDEDGNLQKYQIQYSENMNGELVPLLETIQILPVDYEEQVISAQENCSSNEEPQSTDSLITTNNEEIISHDSEAIAHPNEEMDILSQNNVVNSKELNISAILQNPEESEELFDGNSQTETANEETIETENQDRLALVTPKIEDMSEDYSAMEDDESIIPVQHLEIQHCLGQEELYEETIGEKHFGQLFLEENRVIDANQLIRSENVVASEQPTEFYHILNSVAIDSDHVLKETGDHPKTNILKKAVQKSLLKDFINSDKKILYVQALPEKENLTVMDIESFTRPNSRSLLKCNQPPQAIKQSTNPSAEDKHSQKNLNIKAVSRAKETKPIQTYLRTKEAKQARQFMNFINSTTITQVPERKGRLPRKQQIKPLKHPDEDIVVKEMIVSSAGFVEPISAEARKYLPVMEYVELIDSGDEMCNDKKKKKGNETDELVEIEISDTDESDVGAVELESIPNDKINNEEKQGIKKKRGRPPKSKISSLGKKDSYPNSPPKISRLDSDVESVTSTLQVIRMENEHLDNAVETNNQKPNISNFEEKSTKNECREESTTDIESKEKLSQIGLKNNACSNSNEEASKKAFEYKYECEKCKTRFINKFLQSRHNCVQKVVSSFSCDVCQQKFSNIGNLNLHKRSHAKGQPTVKSVSMKIPQAVKEAPKTETASIKPPPSAASSRTSVISKAPFRIQSRQSVLPSKNPRPSSICIKNTRASILPLKTKPLVVPAKSAMQLPKTSSLPVKNHSKDASESTVTLLNVAVKDEAILKTPTTKSNHDKSPNTIFKCEKQCNHCSMRFPNYSLWFDHQVLKHGLKTPDKSIGEKKQKKIVKEKVTHNGIRTAPTVAKNFSMLKNMVQQI